MEKVETDKIDEDSSSKIVHTEAWQSLLYRTSLENWQSL